MKNQHENLSESDRLEKEKLIDSIAATLRKHCTSKYDVECFIYSITECSKFISELQQYDHDIVFNIKGIESMLRDHDGNIKLFEVISNDFISGIILSGQLKEGNHLIYQMNDDLQSAI